MSPLTILAYPFRYFRLENNHKRWLDAWPTAILALFMSVPYIFVRGPVFFEPNGLLDKVLTLTSCLTGFYVAALVAAATFQHKDLDKVIKSGTIALVGHDQDGNIVRDLLSRRELACHIFGYLSFLSLALSILIGIAISLSSIDWKSYNISTEGPSIEWIRGLIIYFYCTLIAHLVVVTNFGLYYLMDRLWRRDAVITTPRGEEIEDEAA